MFFHILGMSSSQLTNLYFSEGWVNHQPDNYSIVQCGAPQWCLLVYKPHEYYSYLRTINHSEIGVMCTNWTLSWGLTFINYLGGHHRVENEDYEILWTKMGLICKDRSFDYWTSDCFDKSHWESLKSRGPRSYVFMINWYIIKIYS